MSVPGPFFFTFALLLAAPIAVFLHELGHAVVGRLAGFVVTSFGLGIARPWLVVPVRGVKVYWCAVRPLQGITFSLSPDLYPSRARFVALFLGGMLANAAFAALGGALWVCSPWARDLWFVFSLTNASFALTSLIPIRFRVGRIPVRSDGAWIIRILRTGAIAQSAPLVVESLEGLRGLWQGVGDTLSLRYYMLAASVAWADLGDIPQATALLDEAETIPDVPPPFVAAFGMLARAEVALIRGDFDEAESALVQAESAYRVLNQAVGLFLTNLIRASAHPAKGDAAGATAQLDALAAEPIAASRPPLETTLRVLRLGVVCSGSDGDAVADRLDEYEHARRRYRSASLDLRAYEALAGYRSRSGDHAGAVAAWRLVLEAIGELAGDWTDSSRRARYLELQAGRIERIRADFEAAGCAAELDVLLRRVGNGPPKDAWKPKDRRLRRWSLYALLANLATMVLVIASDPDTGKEPGRSFAVLAGLLAFGVVLWLIYLLLDQTIGRLLPPVRRFGGATLLLLAAFPWLLAGLIMVAAR